MRLCKKQVKNQSLTVIAMKQDNRLAAKPIKILKIILGNTNEEDEVIYISENGKHLIIFCKDFMKKMPARSALRVESSTGGNYDYDKLYYNNATNHENVMNYVKSNISQFKIYTTDGEYIN